MKEFIYNTTLSIPSLTSQSAILGHVNLSDDCLLINHIYKLHITPETEKLLTLSIQGQLLIKLKELRKKLANMNLKKMSKYLKKLCYFVVEIV